MFKWFGVRFMAAIASLLFFALPSTGAVLRTRGVTQEGIQVYEFKIPTTAVVNDFSEAIPSCERMTIYWDRGNAAAATLYSASPTDDTLAEVIASTQINAFSTSTRFGPFTPDKSSVRFVVNTINASVQSTARITCSNFASAPSDSQGLIGTNMTWQTVEYMSTLKKFEGLDPTISWTRFWIDPYSGNDANAGTFEAPFKTLAKWKSLATFGTWFTVKNGRRNRPMYISQQTFPFPTTETCVIGESVTYDAGASTSRLLDIDVANGVFVAETLTGNPLIAGKIITTGSTSGIGCSFTVGTQAPSLTTGGTGANTGLCSLDNLDPCDLAQRFTGTGCLVGICSSPTEAGIALTTTPPRYAGRIVTILDVEDTSTEVVIHADGRTVGDIAGASLGGGDDRNGLFIAVSAASYGCLGVANFQVRRVIDDVISQHQEGCVKTLNVYADGVLNVTTNSAFNNNIITTHGGTLGRGGVMSINGGGVGFKYTNGAGAPIAPTSVASGSGPRSSMILIGKGAYVTDLSTWGGGAAKGQVSQSSGGDLTILGHEISCRNLSGGATGCDGIAATTVDGSIILNLIRNVIRHNGAGNAAISAVTSGSNLLTLRAYRPSFTGGWNMYTNAAGGAIAVDIKGAIYSDALEYYWWDQSGNITGNISGIYDNNGSNRWHQASTDYNTAALMDAATPVSLLSDSASVQTDNVEYTVDASRRCASTGLCFNTYTEGWTASFPKVIYDYLTTPITGYTESGQRNYGAR
jgi:hypothetical protein